MTKPHIPKGSGGRELEWTSVMEKWRVSQAFCLFLVFSLLTLQANGQFFRPEASYRQDSQTFSVATDPLTWWGSNWAAEHTHARLAVPSDALRLFLLSDPLRFSKRHWLGVAKIPTRWKWLDGSELLTYRGEMKISIDSTVDHYLEREGDAFSCLLKCQTPFIAIQGLVCYCYDTLPDADASTEPPHCTRDIYCFGSEERASVYDYSHLFHRFPWNGDSDSGRVAYIRKVPPGNIAFLHTSSSPRQSRRFLCKTQPTQSAYPIKPQTGEQFNCSGEICASTSFNMQSWDLARGSCSSFTGTDLASLTISDFDDLARVTSEWEELWIGLRREGVTKTIDGSDYKVAASENELLPVWSCLAASVQQAGRGGYDIELHFTNCSTTLPAIWEKPPDSTQGLTTMAAPTSLPAASTAFDGDGAGTFATIFPNSLKTQNSTSNDTDKDPHKSDDSTHPAIIAGGVLSGIIVVAAVVAFLSYYHCCVPVPVLPITNAITGERAVTHHPSGGNAGRNNMELPAIPGRQLQPPDRTAHDYLQLQPDPKKPDDPDDGYEVPVSHTMANTLPKDVDADDSIYEEPDQNHSASEVRSVSKAVAPASTAGDTLVDSKDDGGIYETLGELQSEEQGQNEQTAKVVRL